jgi:hypothetical protein
MHSAAFAIASAALLYHEFIQMTAIREILMTLPIPCNFCIFMHSLTRPPAFTQLNNGRHGIHRIYVNAKL